MQRVIDWFTKLRLLVIVLALFMAGVGTLIGYAVAWGAADARVTHRIDDHERRLQAIETDTRSILVTLGEVNGDVRAILRELRR